MFLNFSHVFLKVLDEMSAYALNFGTIKFLEPYIWKFTERLLILMLLFFQNCGLNNQLVKLSMDWPNFPCKTFAFGGGVPSS